MPRVDLRMLHFYLSGNVLTGDARHEAQHVDIELNEMQRARLFDLWNKPDMKEGIKKIVRVELMEARARILKKIFG